MNEITKDQLSAHIKDFADVFTGKARFAGGLKIPDGLNKQTLDYSTESLLEVNRYLKSIRGEADAMEAHTYNQLVTSAGAYLGEVIIKHSELKPYWHPYSEYIKDNPGDASIITECVGTLAILRHPKSPHGMTLPINKIQRFIHEGDENCLHFYALASIQSFQKPPFWKFWSK